MFCTFHILFLKDASLCRDLGSDLQKNYETKTFDHWDNRIFWEIRESEQTDQREERGQSYVFFLVVLLMLDVTLP